MNSTLKKLAATVVVAGAITAGTAGAAFAADGSSGGSTGGAATSQTTRHPALRVAIRRHALKIVLEQLGVSRQDLRQALLGGQTISQYATAQGKDQKVLADALTKAADDAITRAVTNGKITQARGATMTAKVPARVDKFLNRTWGRRSA